MFYENTFIILPLTLSNLRLSVCVVCPRFQRWDAAKLQTVFAIIFFAFGKKNIYLLSNATHIRNKHIKGHYIFYKQMQKKINIFYNILAYNIEHTTTPSQSWRHIMTSSSYHDVIIHNRDVINHQKDARKARFTFYFNSKWINNTIDD